MPRASVKAGGLSRTSLTSGPDGATEGHEESKNITGSAAKLADEDLDFVSQDGAIPVIPGRNQRPSRAKALRTKSIVLARN